ncbi:GNAT family N-acetyltransferase [Thermodesulfobacteriota bacterium]
MIELQPFQKVDCIRLINWIPDARFLMQFAGPKYTFPLDERQLLKTMENTVGDDPSYYMFKAVMLPEQQIIGHIELMNLNREKRTTHMGSVLIGDPGIRGKGLGTEMIKKATGFAFDIIGVNEVTLTVYDFNKSAISCYNRAGFENYRFKAKGRRFEDEYWDMIIMRLKREDLPTQS